MLSNTQNTARVVQNSYKLPLFQIISVNLNWISLNPQEVELELNLDWQEEEFTYLLFKEAFVKSLFKQHLKFVLANFTFLVKSNSYMWIYWNSNSFQIHISVPHSVSNENSELNWNFKGCQIIFSSKSYPFLWGKGFITVLYDGISCSVIHNLAPHSNSAVFEHETWDIVLFMFTSH